MQHSWKLWKFVTFDSGVRLTRRLNLRKAKNIFYNIKIILNTVDDYLMETYVFCMELVLCVCIALCYEVFDDNMMILWCIVMCLMLCEVFDVVMTEYDVLWSMWWCYGEYMNGDAFWLAVVMFFLWCCASCIHSICRKDFCPVKFKGRLSSDGSIP